LVDTQDGGPALEMGVQVSRPGRFFPPEDKAEVVELIRTTGKRSARLRFSSPGRPVTGALHRLIDQEKAHHQVSQLCRVLGDDAVLDAVVTHDLPAVVVLVVAAHASAWEVVDGEPALAIPHIPVRLARVWVVVAVASHRSPRGRCLRSTR
jgi:hypothetical protein